MQILCQLLTTAPIIFLPYSMGARAWVWPHWQSYKFAGCKDLMEEPASEGPICDTNTQAELMEVWGSGPSSVLLHLIISFLSYSLWMKNRFNSSLPRNKINFNVFMIFYPFFFVSLYNNNVPLKFIALSTKNHIDSFRYSYLFSLLWDQ